MQGTFGAARRSLSQLVLFTLIAFATVLPSPFAHDAGAGSAGVTQIDALTTATSTTVRNGDGTFTTTMFDTPVNYRDDGGKWQSIDSTLVPSPDPSYVENARNSFHAQFKQQLDGDFMRVEIDGKQYGFSLVGAGNVARDVAGVQATYANATPGVTLRYAVVGAAVKETLVLANARVPDHLRFLLAPPDGVDLAAQKAKDGSWTVAAPDDGPPLFQLEPPTVAETLADGSLSQPSTDAVSLSVSQVGHGLAVDLQLDAKWLHAKARRFPVVVDPTIAIQPAVEDAYFDANCATCTRATSEGDRLWIGADASTAWRSALRFDLGDIPAGVTLAQAKLGLFYSGHELYTGSGVSSANQIDVHRLTAAWSKTTSTSGSLTYDPTPVASYTLPASPDRQWMSWDVTSAVQAWYGGTQTNFGLLLKRSAEALGAGGIRVPSSLYVEPTLRPKLEVTWSGDGVDLLQPDTLHSNGADLRWTRYTGPSGAPFVSYEVHRSPTPRFTPSASTLLATITDPSVTTYRDTTAAPSKSFTYKIVVNGSAPSGEQTVTLPADGQASKVLQPDSAAGKATYVTYGWGATEGHGGEGGLRVGRSGSVLHRSLVAFDLRDVPTDSTVKSATISLWEPWTTYTTGSVRLHRVTAAWNEGTGNYSSTGDGATWNETQGGVPWANPGGDFESTPAATVPIPYGAGPRWDNFDVTGLAQQWVSGATPNDGVLLRTDFMDYPNTVLNDKPRAFWRLGEGDGSATAADATGNGINGTYQGAQLGVAGGINRDSSTAMRVNTDNTTALVPPPPNDNFANAQTISGASGQTKNTNSSATKETGEPNVISGNGGGNSIWYSWTAPATGSYEFDTLGSTYCDTIMGVFTGTAFANLTELAGDDDSAGHLKSRVVVSATAGTTYKIALDGWDGDDGTLLLNWRPNPATTVAANDSFANAVSVAGQTGGAGASSVGASKETGEPSHAGNAGGRSLWWKYTAPATGTLTVDTAGSDFDTVLGVYTGSSVSGLTQVAADNNSGSNLTSWLQFRAVAGTTYYVAVDGVGGASGNVSLYWSYGMAGLNAGDNFDFAGTAAYSVEAWIRPSEIDNGWRRIFSKEDANAAGRQGWSLWLHGSWSQAGKAYFAMERWRDGTETYVSTSGTAIPITSLLNTWTHVVATYDGTTVKIYVNGVLQASAPSSTSMLDTTRPFTVGYSDWGDGRFFGDIDEPAVYDRALSAAEVGNHYDAGQSLDNQIGYDSDDVSVAPTLRPKLTMTYTDGSHAVAPTVAVSSPAGGDTVGGSVGVIAAATDDRRVDKVEFLVDGGVVQSVTASPFQITWDSKSVSNGSHTLTARATDDAGNVTTSPAVSVTVDNTAPPLAALAAPADAAYADAVRADKPGAYWRLGEASGTSAADASGNGVAATYRGTVRLGTRGVAVNDADTALTLAGAGYVDAGDVFDFAGNAAFTLEAWVRPTGAAVDQRLLSKKYNDNGYYLQLNGDGSLQFSRFLNSTTADTAWYGPGLAANQWSHVAASYDGTTMRLYVNGALVAQKASSLAVADNPGIFTVGADRTAATLFQGDVDEAAVYPAALSLDRIRSHYDAGMRVKQAYSVLVKNTGPAAYWRLGDPAGSTTVADASGNGVTGTAQTALLTFGAAGGIARDADTSADFGGNNLGVGFGDKLDMAGAQPFSLEAWIKPSAYTADWRRIFSKEDNASAAGRQGYTLWTYNDPAGGPRIGFERMRDGVKDAVWAFAPPVGAWSHVVVTYDGSMLRMYFNGRLVGSNGSTVSLLDNTMPLTVGAVSGGGSPFLGGIDDAAVYTRALSPEEVYSHSQAGHTYTDLVKSAAPLGYWRLGEGVNATTAFDSSGNGNDARYEDRTLKGVPGGIATDADGAARFAGYTGSIDLSGGDNSKFSFAGTAPFSAEAWVRPRTVPGDSSDTIFSTGSWPAGGWNITVNSTYGFAAHRAVNGVNAGPASYGVIVPQAGQWYHVVTTYDGATIRLYVNGGLVGSSADTRALPLPTRPARIDNWGYDGDVDEAAIYGRALTPAEIYSHYDAGQPSSATVQGTVRLNADAADDVGVTHVEFFDNGVRFLDKASAPWTTDWSTLDASQPAYDGQHVLTVKAYDRTNQVVASQDVPVTVANAAGTKFQSTYTAPADAVPPAVTYDPTASTQQANPVNVTVTNTSTSAWSSANVAAQYTWQAPDGTTVQPAAATNQVALPADVPAGQAATVQVPAVPPALPDGVTKSDYKLQVDLVDKTNGQSFAAKGDKPFTNNVVVNKKVDVGLGLEKFYEYWGQEAGGGMNHLVNVASGNSILRWTPWDEPGRGLSTVLDLTYNSLEEKSESPVGNNFSLAISHLSRFGNPIDIHPNKADTIGGRATRFVDVTDGDGTTLRFTSSDGVYWKPPAGVHLFLRVYSTTDPTRKWAVTRPDRVTFFYDADGYPTAISDKNGNTITYALQDTPPGEDPGGPKKRITAVTDAGGRSFTISYYSKAEVKKAQVRGKIKDITDHAGHALHFDYYDDGNLLRITQRGGVAVDGIVTPDRTFVFTYTTSNGAGPAIPNAADRVNPEPKTPNESTRLYSVRDPRGSETTFAYLGPGNGTDRWKLASTTDRSGATTSFSYDTVNLVTTVNEPLSRTTKYAYDTDGKVVQITNPLNQSMGVEWSADRMVTKVTEPTGVFTSYTYNENGFLTSQTDERGKKTVLTYRNDPVTDADGSTKDVSTSWETGRTIPHLSLLETKTAPAGVATTTVPDDYMWTFTYDAKGNLTRAQEPGPEHYASTFAYNADGTQSTETDANGNVTTFVSYDANGLVTQARDALGKTTSFGYDADGNTLWIQDPNHVSGSGSDTTSYRSYFYYDPFHRLIKQTAPKSTKFERGVLVTSGVSYDPNDNIATETAPYLPSDAKAVTKHAYDAMDRETLATNPDTSVDPQGERTAMTYDSAGRLTSITSPKGMLTTATDKDFAEFYEYDPLDRKTKQTSYDVNGTTIASTRSTIYCYDLAGDLRSQTSPKGAATFPGCPAPTNPYTELTAAQAQQYFTSKMTYWPDHSLKSRTDPAGHTQSFDYDDDGNQSVSTDANSHTVKQYYDQRDLLSRTVQQFKTSPDFATPRDITSKYVYDGNRNVVKEISPRAWDASPDTTTDKTNFPKYVTQHVYDANDQEIKTILPTDGSTTAEQHYVYKSYDDDGNLLTTTEPTKDTTAPASTADGVTRYSYFDPGWPRTEQEPSATGPTTFDYTGRGFQTSRITPTQRKMIWRYNVDGTLKEEIDPQHEGQSTQYTYDANNNLVHEHAASGANTADQVPMDTDLTYDGFDQTTQIKQTRTSTTAAGKRNPRWTTMTYDLNGNVTQRVDDTEQKPDGTTDQGRVNDFTYDAADWVREQVDHGKKSPDCSDDQRITTDYTSTGQESLRTIYKGNGSCGWDLRTTKTTSYYANDDPWKTVTKNAGGTTLQSHTLSYEDPNGYYANGNKTQDDYSMNGPNASCTSTCSQKFTYDAEDRVTNWDSGHSSSIAYQLDPHGNITRQADSAGGTVRYQYGRGDQMTAQTDDMGTVQSKFWYDADGNMSCSTDSGGSQSNCSISGNTDPSGHVQEAWTYDDKQRANSYRAFAGGSRTDSANYTYDAFNRTAKEEEFHNDSRGSRSTSYDFVGLSDQVSEERSTGGANPTKSFSYDAWGEHVGQTNDPNGSSPQNQLYDTNADGDVSMLIGQSNTATASYGYKPYGDQDNAASGGDDQKSPNNPYRFEAKRFDPGSKTLDMGARRFSPSTSRFLQEDVYANALGELGLADDPLTMNRYALSGANPINFVDIDGHGWFDDATNWVKDKAKGAAGWVGKHAHTILDACSYAPVVGSACSVGDAALYAAQGKWKDAAFAAAGAIPGGKVLSGARDAMKLGKFAEKHAPQEIGIGKKLLGKGEQIAGNACHNSFAPGTPVLMADGTEKAIGAVRVGDVVEATDVATGLTEGHVVTKVIVGKGVRQMADVTVAGETIHATANHWFFTENRGWVKAGELQAGDILRSADGTLSTVERVQAYTLVFTTVLNLEVEGLHDFYVGDVPVLVHNSGCRLNLDSEAKNLHSLIPDKYKQGQINTAVLRAEDKSGRGRFIAASSQHELEGEQVAGLRSGWIHAKGPGHAEETAINEALRRGWKPTDVGSRWSVCKECQKLLRRHGIRSHTRLRRW